MAAGPADSLRFSSGRVSAWVRDRLVPGLGHRWRRLPPWRDGIAAARKYLRSLVAPTLWLLLAVGIGLLVGAAAVLLPPQMVVAPLGLIGIIAGLGIWGIERLERVPDRTTAWLFIAFVGVFCTLPLYLALHLPGLPWISLHRALLALLVPLFAICCAGSPEIRARIANGYRASPEVFWLIGAFFASMLCSFPFARAIGTPLSMLSQGLLQWVMPFLMCVAFVRSDRDRTRFVRFLALCLMVTVSEAIIESHIHERLFVKLLPHSFFTDNPMFQGIFKTLLRDGVYRASANFNVPLSFGEYCALVAPLCLSMILKQGPAFDKILGAVAFLFAAAGLLLANSRGGIVGFFAGGLIFAGLYCQDFLHRNRGGQAALAVIGMLPPALLSIPMLLLVSPHARKILIGGRESAGSTSARLEQWQLAWPHIEANPIFGAGAGTGADTVGWRTPAGFLTIDSYVISLLVELGIPGLLIFFGFLFAIARRNYRLMWRRPDEAPFAMALVASTASFAVNRLVLSQQENHTTLFLIAGLSVSLARSTYTARAVQAGDSSARAFAGQG